VQQKIKALITMIKRKKHQEQINKKLVSLKKINPAENFCRILFF
jgi:hypothetical protein